VRSWAPIRIEARACFVQMVLHKGRPGRPVDNGATGTAATEALLADRYLAERRRPAFVGINSQLVIFIICRRGRLSVSNLIPECCCCSFGRAILSCPFPFCHLDDVLARLSFTLGGALDSSARALASTTTFSGRPAGRSFRINLPIEARNRPSYALLAAVGVEHPRELSSGR
jgi:hypothetical protein